MQVLFCVNFIFLLRCQTLNISNNIVYYYDSFTYYNYVISELKLFQSFITLFVINIPICKTENLFYIAKIQLFNPFCLILSDL